MGLLALQGLQAVQPMQARSGPEKLTALIKALFGNDEQGGMWLPEPDTCFTDTAGTTAAGVGDTVARINDISGNGNHAIQATAAFRPALGRTVEGGRRNILVNSDQPYDNTNGWSIPGATLTRDFAVVDGRSATRSQRVTEFAISSLAGAQIVPLSGPTAGRTFTASVWVKNNGGANRVRTQLQARGGASATQSVIADEVILGDQPQRITASITVADNDRVDIRTFFVVSSEAGVSYDLLTWDYQLEEAATASPYQRVGASELDVTEAGRRELWYLAFDGIDDFMETAAIDLTGTSEVTPFFAGTLPVTGNAAVMHHPGNVNWGVQANSWALMVAFLAGTLSAYTSGDSGDQQHRQAEIAVTSPRVWVAGLRNVLNLATTEAVKLRRDGAVPSDIVGGAANATTLGSSGGYRNDKVSIGKAGSSHLLGNIFALGFVSRLASAETPRIETVLAARSGVTLQKLAPEFVLQMRTTTASETITLPMTTNVDVDVDWGDGSDIETFTTDSPSHEYVTATAHDIKVTGSCGSFAFNNGGDKDKLLAVLNGGTGFTAGSWAGGFRGCTNLESANFTGLNTSAVTNMANMFLGCSNMATCDVSYFNTANVVSMQSMFLGCSNLTNVDVSGFDTAKVANMANMFLSCPTLPTVNVSGWDTGNVITTARMFENCNNLASLDVSGWNTAKMTVIRKMFRECNNLTTVDVSGWNTGLVTNMSEMFYSCNILSSLDVSGWDTSNVVTTERMFFLCNSLTSDPGIHAFNVTALTNATSMCNLANNMLSTAEYDTILTNWEAQAVNNDVPVHFGNATHSGDGTIARDALTLPVADGGPGWTITDGGPA